MIILLYMYVTDNWFINLYWLLIPYIVLEYMNNIIIILPDFSLYNCPLTTTVISQLHIKYLQNPIKNTLFTYSYIMYIHSAPYLYSYIHIIINHISSIHRIVHFYHSIETFISPYNIFIYVVAHIIYFV